MSNCIRCGTTMTSSTGGRQACFECDLRKASVPVRLSAEALRVLEDWRVKSVDNDYRIRSASTGSIHIVISDSVGCVNRCTCGERGRLHLDTERITQMVKRINSGSYDELFPFGACKGEVEE